MLITVQKTNLFQDNIFRLFDNYNMNLVCDN